MWFSQPNFLKNPAEGSKPTFQTTGILNWSQKSLSYKLDEIAQRERFSTSFNKKQGMWNLLLTLLRTVCGFFSDADSVHWTKLRMSAPNVSSGFRVANLPVQATPPQSVAQPN